jgi:hypothetical protein
MKQAYSSVIIPRAWFDEIVFVPTWTLFRKEATRKAFICYAATDSIVVSIASAFHSETGLIVHPKVGDTVDTVHERIATLISRVGMYAYKKHETSSSMFVFPFDFAELMYAEQKQYLQGLTPFELSLYITSFERAYQVNPDIAIEYLQCKTMMEVEKHRRNTNVSGSELIHKLKDSTSSGIPKFDGNRFRSATYGQPGWASSLSVQDDSHGAMNVRAAANNANKDKQE